MQKIIDEVFDELETGRKEQFAMLCTKVLEGLPTKNYDERFWYVLDDDIKDTIKLIKEKGLQNENKDTKKE